MNLLKNKKNQRVIDRIEMMEKLVELLRSLGCRCDFYDKDSGANRIIDLFEKYPRESNSDRVVVMQGAPSADVLLAESEKTITAIHELTLKLLPSKVIVDFVNERARNYFNYKDSLSK